MNLLHFALRLGSCEQKNLFSVSTIYDTGAAPSCGYTDYQLAIAKEFPNLVNDIYSESNGIIEELPTVIEYYTPYYTDKKLPITLKISLGKMSLLIL